MELNEKIIELRSEANTLEKILEKFPDLREDKDRWNTIRLYSRKINNIADEVCIHHSCGCCPDSCLLVRPYKTFHGKPIFSDPTHFVIGQKNDWGYGEISYNEWENKLVEEDINQSIIDKIRKYFKENEPGDYEDDEDNE